MIHTQNDLMSAHRAHQLNGIAAGLTIDIVPPIARVLRENHLFLRVLFGKSSGKRPLSSGTLRESFGKSSGKLREAFGKVSGMLRELFVPDPKATQGSHGPFTRPSLRSGERVSIECGEKPEQKIGVDITSIRTYQIHLDVVWHIFRSGPLSYHEFYNKLHLIHQSRFFPPHILHLLF